MESAVPLKVALNPVEATSRRNKATTICQAASTIKVKVTGSTNPRYIGES